MKVLSQAPEKEKIMPLDNGKQPKPPEVQPKDEETVVNLVRKRTDNALRFSPYAWAKLIWLRDRGNTEISVFGISSLADLLYVEDVKIVKQTAGVASFDFDEEFLNHYLHDMVKAGRQPCEVFRIWIHTHPSGASPSGKDLNTFARTTKTADWGVMCIIGSDNETSARMRLRVSNGRIAVDVTLAVQVDWSGEFAGVLNEDARSWNAEYEECVEREVCSITFPVGGYAVPYSSGRSGVPWDSGYDARWRTTAYAYDGDSIDNEENAGGFLPEKSDHDELDDRDVPSDDENLHEFFVAQKIYLIALSSSGDTNVFTEDYWFTYAGVVELKVEEGEEINGLSDICAVSPQSWGEVEWTEDSFAIKVSRYIDGNFFPVIEEESADSATTEETETEEELQGESIGP